MTNTVKTTRKTILASIAVVLAASLALSSGMATPAMALSKKFDAKGDSRLADFDIKSYGFAGNNVYIQVYGHAGRTVPVEHMDVYAYAIVTDAGMYVSDSHEAQHSDDEQVANKAWHGHLAEVDEEGCLTEIGSFKSQAKIAGQRVFLTETGATEIIKVMTVRLELQVEDPDNPPPGVTCIAKVMETFDEASGL